MRVPLMVLACTLMFASPSSYVPAEGAAQTLRYSILLNGHKSGSEVDTFGASGTLDSTFEFNDRGRGPKIEAHYVLASDGLPTRVDITGVDYLKSPVDEHFATEQGKAHWKSTSEEASGDSGAFYISINGPSAETALLAHALEKAGSAGLRLFPSGQAHLEKLTETTLQDHGQSVHVTEYAITGLGFAPVPIWLDDQWQFFASPGPWGATLREGWEATNERLYDLQLKAENDWLAKIAKELTGHPLQPVAIEHVRLFDSVHAATRDDQTVVISGERILAVGPAASTKVPKNSMHIDGRGKTLLPGLFDMHVHAGSLDGILHIASGVTAVRDMGNSITELERLQEQWEKGTAIGPRVWKAGLIDGKDALQAPTGIYVSTQDEANAAVNRYADLGYIQIKLYSSLNPAFVPGIVKLAHERGLRVSGHVPNRMIASEFVREGADEIQHINFIFLNFFADKVKDTRTPERFTAVGEYAAGLDLQSKPVKDFVELLQQHHTTVDVTLVAFEGMFTGRPKQVSPNLAPILNRLPAQIQRGAYIGGLPVTAANDQTYKDSYSAMLRMTKRLFDAGVPVLVGTDATAGLMLHRELELEVKAGIPPGKALQNATYLAATVLKQQSELGSIEPGKRADLLLVDGDPATNISDIRRCRMVMKNGMMFESSKLYAAVGILPAN